MATETHPYPGFTPSKAVHFSSLTECTFQVLLTPNAVPNAVLNLKSELFRPEKLLNFRLRKSLCFKTPIGFTSPLI